MIFGPMLSVVQNILASLQHSQLVEACTVLGHRSQLDHLKDSVESLRSVLLDPRAQQELPHEAHFCMQKLKDVVYDADDLLDEFITLAEQKGVKEDGSVVSEQVCLLFSRFRLTDVADTISEGVNKIRMILDDVATRINYLPIRKRRVVSKFNVNDDHDDSIIGREDDVSTIIDMLTDTDTDTDTDVYGGVSCVTIVGTGGLGKTALLRLVYNQERIASAFPLRLWACVSDQDPSHLDVTQIVRKIMRLNAIQMIHSNDEQLMERLMEQMAGRKFLLVLDDVLVDKQDQWLNLVEFFKVGKRGSRILVTTRSRETAKIIGDGPMYELQGLSEENSWCLFKNMASFEQKTLDDDIINIGGNIVKVCDGVPLAIRVVGTLLYGQDKSYWKSFHETVLSEIRNCKNDIILLLKLSFEQLEPPLKSCFSLCAVFPKGFEIEKEMLISLWIAQGFVIPLHEDQNIEDAAEEYFSVLLQRCFLEVAQKDEFGYGEILSCKMCSPVYDIAQEINFFNTENSVAKTRIRTYLEVGMLGHLYTDELLRNWSCLRALVLRGPVIQRLSDSIGDLTHLRLLDLSYNSRLEMIPESITNLHNLQRLVLRSCFMLKELPKDLTRLVKLKVLDIAYCYRLKFLPSDMHNLTCLQMLSNFKLEDNRIDQLEGLKALNLRGHLELCIRIPKNLEYIGKDGMCLRNKVSLIDLSFCIEYEESETRGDFEEALFQDLQPHSNLKGLMVLGYEGVKLPNWARDGNLTTFLPNLVRLQLSSCSKLQHLPNLGGLHHLKYLFVAAIPNLEYMDDSEEPPFFSSLEELSLYDLPNLKLWREGELIRDSDTSPRFPRLKSLSVDSCQKMISTLLCPSVEDLKLHDFNKNLRVVIRVTNTNNNPVKSHNNGIWITGNNTSPRKPLSLNTDNIEWFNPQPREVCQSLNHICVANLKSESLSESEEVFHGCSSFLQTLTIFNCFELRSLSGALEHLTALDTLILDYLPSLVISPEEEENGMPWRCLHQSLRYLELKELTTLEELPSGMQYLSNLQILKIWDCFKLKSLPKWMPKLSCLRVLDVSGCYEVYKTYEKSDGEDWFNIQLQHIPHVSIRY